MLHLWIKGQLKAGIIATLALPARPALTEDAGFAILCGLLISAIWGSVILCQSQTIHLKRID